MKGLPGLSLAVVALTAAPAAAEFIAPRSVFAEGSFRDGIEARDNASVARSHFARAAAEFDHLWQYGDYSIMAMRTLQTPPLRTPAMALNRGRAHFLAGQLPQAIRAFRDGLDLAPWDAELQRDLRLCRAAVAYPAETDPAARVRPDPLRSLRHRVSPWDLFAAASAASLLLTVGLARRLTTRDGWSVPVAAVGLGGVVLVAVAAWVIDAEARADRANPVVVIAADTVLRTGNGTAFPARVEAPLPRGAEVRELARRGGWVQVQLPGGAVGWVPEAVVL